MAEVSRRFAVIPALRSLRASTRQLEVGSVSAGDVGVGTVYLWPDAVALPADHLVCNGQSVSRTTWEDLFDVYGTTFGNGDGSTTFGLPNLSGPGAMRYVVRAA